MDEKKKGNWHFYIAINELEQFDDLIGELTFAKKKAEEILDERSDEFSVEIKSKDWSDEPEADIMSTTIKY